MMRDTLVKDSSDKPNSALEIELLSCSARDYVDSASASSHNLGDYMPKGVTARDCNYDKCESLLKTAAISLGAEVITDVRESTTIKPDEDIQGRFELVFSIRGTALVPNKYASNKAPQISPGIKPDY